MFNELFNWTFGLSQPFKFKYLRPKFHGSKINLHKMYMKFYDYERFIIKNIKSNFYKFKPKQKCNRHYKKYLLGRIK